MKKLRKSIVALTLLMTTLVSVVPCRGAERVTSAPTSVRVAAPVVVAAKTNLSPQQLAMYRQKSAQSRQAATNQAAGASKNGVWWVLGGVAVVAGVIALASGGGGGGGGGY